MIRRFSLVMRALLPAACIWAQTSPATAPATKPAELAVTVKDNGKTVNLGANATVAISLDGNATTGYTWSVTKVDGPALEQVGSVDYVPLKVQPGVVGSGGTSIAHFKPVKAGQSVITMGYARSWEKDTPPAQTFTVTIVVDKLPTP